MLGREWREKCRLLYMCRPENNATNYTSRRMWSNCMLNKVNSRWIKDLNFKNSRFSTSSERMASEKRKKVDARRQNNVYIRY